VVCRLLGSALYATHLVEVLILIEHELIELIVPLFHLQPLIDSSTILELPRIKLNCRVKVELGKVRVGKRCLIRLRGVGVVAPREWQESTVFNVAIGNGILEVSRLQHCSTLLEILDKRNLARWGVIVSADSGQEHVVVAVECVDDGSILVKFIIVERERRCNFVAAEEHLMILRRSEYIWTVLLKDSPECLTMAVAEDICLQFNDGNDFGMRCQGLRFSKDGKVARRFSPG
jgi:hypothetical protein